MKKKGSRERERERERGGEVSIQKKQKTTVYQVIYASCFFLANSTLKQCIKSTRINISRNQIKSFNLSDLRETVSNLRECIFHDFDILTNIAENGCTRKKSDIQY